MSFENENSDGHGRYQIKSLLGKGGFGTVYEALDKKLNRVVALKLVKEGISEQGLARFQREADICFRLRHPNVITIYDAVIRDKKAFIVMERLQAKELSDMLADGALDEKLALSVVVQIANAIDYLDKEGILHRDVKPQNIMVTKDGRAVLMDFNLSLADDMTALTATGIVVGTSRYMAPELWFGDPYTIASEIYALGLVFHSMLSGVPPPAYSAETIKQGISPLAPPSAINNASTVSYDAFLTWVTNPDKSLRCSSVKDFLRGLSQASQSAKATVMKYNPELCKDEHVEIVPKLSASHSSPARRGWPFKFAALLLFLVFFSLLYNTVKKPSVKTEVNKKAIELSLCPFPDGCYALFKRKLDNPPTWKILSNRVVLKKGKCFPRGRYWLVDARGLKDPGKLHLQLRSGEELLVEQEFQLAASVFKEPIKAFVGKKRISLKWQLNGDVEALIKGRFTGADRDPRKKLAKDTVSFKTREKALYFYYDFFVGARKLVSNKVRLSLVSRRNAQHFPMRPPWKIQTRPLVVPGGLIVVGGRKLSMFGIDRDDKGPMISLRWQSNANPLGAPIATLAHEGSSFFCLLYRRGDLLLSKIDSQRRSIGSDKLTENIGTSIGEWFEQLTDRGVQSFANTILSVGKGLVAVAFVNNEDRAFVHLVDFRDEEVKVQHVVSLGQAEATWLGKLGNGLVAITANDGQVLQTCLRVKQQDDVLTKSSQQTLFTESSKGMVFTIGSQKKDAPEAVRQETQVELAVTPLANKIWAIRLGGKIGFFELKERKSREVRAPIRLPLPVAQRISSALQLEDGSIAIVSVEVSRGHVPTSRAFLHKVELSKFNGLVKKKQIGKSVVFIGYEAICGGVGSWRGSFYVPALEYVHVISKRDGEHLGKFHAEQRPNYAVPYKGMLFVPLNTRRLLGIDLIDEY